MLTAQKILIRWFIKKYINHKKAEDYSEFKKKSKLISLKVCFPICARIGITSK